MQLVLSRLYQLSTTSFPPGFGRRPA